MSKKKDWMIFSKPILNSKMSCLSTSFKKKKGQNKVTEPVIFSKLYVPKRHLALKSLFQTFFSHILKTVLVVDLTF